jgi:hypothetical protein
MTCGLLKPAHTDEGYCPKQFIPKSQWLKFQPAYIPKPPGGFTRSTWPSHVRYASNTIVIHVPVRDFLKSRDPEGVLRLAIARGRAILQGVQKTGYPPVSGSRRISR